MLMKHRDDLGREKFLEHVWAWKEKHGGIIIQQLKKLGCSCDWSRQRFTMDPEYSKCVQSVFVDLYKKGMIYRGKRMVNWDPAARTALSDEEVDMIEEKGQLWHLKYPLLDDKGQPKPDEFVVVAEGFRIRLKGSTLELSFEASGSCSLDSARALAEKYVEILAKHLGSHLSLITEEAFLIRTTPPFGRMTTYSPVSVRVPAPSAPGTWGRGER